MAKTGVHDGACVALGAIQLAASAFSPVFLFSGLGSLAGLLLSPDMDWNGSLVFNERTENTYIITRHPARHETVQIRYVWGKVTRRWPPVLREWWQVYALLFRHRKLSHAPFVGTLTRVLWLFPLFAPLVYFFPVETGLFLMGLTIADLVHLLLDL
jgi:uncharacterized metal-binding protein